MRISDIKPEMEIIEKLLVEVKIAGQSKKNNGRWEQKITVKDFSGELKMIYTTPESQYKPLVKGKALAIFKATNRDGFFYVYPRDMQLFSVGSEPPVNSKYAYNDDEPDWDFINRGKVRHGLVCQFIHSFGRLELTKAEIQKIIDLQEFIMTGLSNE